MIRIDQFISNDIVDIRFISIQRKKDGHQNNNFKIIGKYNSNKKCINEFYSLYNELLDYCQEKKSRGYIYICNKNISDSILKSSIIIDNYCFGYIGLDIDNKNIDQIHSLLNILKNYTENEVLICESKSGFHILVKTKTVGEFIIIKNIYKKHQNLIDIIGPASIPVWWPGKDEPILVKDIII
jgi:hypothetical protein